MSLWHRGVELLRDRLALSGRELLLIIIVFATLLTGAIVYHIRHSGGINVSDGSAGSTGHLPER